MKFKNYLEEETFMDHLVSGKPYFTIEIGDKSGWHNIPLRPMPVSKMINGKEVWLEWAKKNC